MDKRRLLRFIVITAVFALISVTAYAQNKLPGQAVPVDNATLEEMKKFADFELPEAEVEEFKKLVDAAITGDGLKNITSLMEEFAGAGNINTGSTKSGISIPNGNAEDDGTSIIIFISESVPFVTLKNYIEASGLNTRFILRGPVGKDPSKLKPTLIFLTELLCEKDLCKDARIEIDPTLFRRYGVERVPAVVVIKDGAAYKHTGAVPVHFVLDRIQSITGGNE